VKIGEFENWRNLGVRVGSNGLSMFYISFHLKCKGLKSCKFQPFNFLLNKLS